MTAGIDLFRDGVAGLRVTVDAAVEALGRAGVADELGCTGLDSARGIVPFLAGDVRDVVAMQPVSVATRDAAHHAIESLNGATRELFATNPDVGRGVAKLNTASYWLDEAADWHAFALGDESVPRSSWGADHVFGDLRSVAEPGIIKGAGAFDAAANASTLRFGMPGTGNTVLATFHPEDFTPVGRYTEAIDAAFAKSETSPERIFGVFSHGDGYGVAELRFQHGAMGPNAVGDDRWFLTDGHGRGYQWNPDWAPQVRSIEQAPGSLVQVVQHGQPQFPDVG